MGQCEGTTLDERNSEYSFRFLGVEPIVAAEIVPVPGVTVAADGLRRTLAGARGEEREREPVVIRERGLPPLVRCAAGPPPTARFAAPGGDIGAPPLNTCLFFLGHVPIRYVQRPTHMRRWDIEQAALAAREPNR